jgi:hypothetical protein
MMVVAQVIFVRSSEEKGVANRRVAITSSTLLNWKSAETCKVN